MKNTKNIIGIIVIAIVVALLFDGVYIVNEQEQAIVTQFGKPVGGAVVEPGLKFKIPFIQKVNYFDKRYLEWDGDRNQVPTRDKKFIFVDSYARWQITDPLQYFIRLRDERGAQSRLDDILDGETRNAIANNDLVELVRSSNRDPREDATVIELVTDTLANIDVGRDSIQVQIQELAKERASDLGIEILDFRFKRINYVEDVRQRVYDRMISERQRIADKFRSEGQGEASRINGEKEKILNQIQSEAFRKAEEIKGDADAQAANIYSNAYNKSGQSRQLYSFLRTLESYQKTIDSSTSVILSTDSDFYRLLKDDDQ